MVRTRFGLLDTIESIPLETKKRLKKKCNNNEQGGNDKKYVETTYSELKSLRDEGKLTPGALYRITDYQCTTTQEGTRSAGNQFDIIVTALSENVLNEDAKAIQHKFEMPKEAKGSLADEPLYFAGIVLIDDISYFVYETNESYSYQSKYLLRTDRVPSLDTVNENFYWFVSDLIWIPSDGYIDTGDTLGFKQDISKLLNFSNSNLAAWKLRYCLDNDEERFAWAKNLYLSPATHNKCIQVTDGDSYIYVRQTQLDNENGLAWVYDENTSSRTSIKEYANFENESLDTEDIIYTPSENIYIGQVLDMGGTSVTLVDFSEQGKGVIYQMIDEYNNDCPYDFKNIQFLRSRQWLQEHEIWTTRTNDEFYVDSYYYTFSIYNQINGEQYLVYDASIQNESISLGWNKVFNNKIRPYIDDFSSTTLNKQILNNIIIAGFLRNDLEFSVYNNTFNNNCHDISCVNAFFNNIFENSCEDIVLENGFSNNIIQSDSKFINTNIEIFGSVFKHNRNITITTTNDAWSINCITIDSSVKDSDIVISRTISDSYIYHDSETEIYIDKLYTAFDRT